MENKSKIVPVRFSPADHSRIELMAQADGLSLSEFVRKKSLGHRIKNRDVEHKLNVNLNRINANLNMLAKHCNYHHEKVDRLELLVELRSIKEGIDNLIEGVSR